LTIVSELRGMLSANFVAFLSFIDIVTEVNIQREKNVFVRRLEFEVDDHFRIFSIFLVEFSERKTLP
jgi:hypothetical protein